MKHLIITNKSIDFLPAGELFSLCFSITPSIDFLILSQSTFDFIISNALLLCVLICLLYLSFAAEVNKSTLWILLLLIFIPYFFEAIILILLIIIN